MYVIRIIVYYTCVLWGCIRLRAVRTHSENANSAQTSWQPAKWEKRMSSRTTVTVTRSVKIGQLYVTTSGSWLYTASSEIVIHIDTPGHGWTRAWKSKPTAVQRIGVVRGGRGGGFKTTRRGSISKLIGQNPLKRFITFFLSAHYSKLIGVFLFQFIDFFKWKLILCWNWL